MWIHSNSLWTIPEFSRKLTRREWKDWDVTRSEKIECKMYNWSGAYIPCIVYLSLSKVA